MSIDHSDFTIAKLVDATSPRFDGKMETIDNLGVDPNNPNTPGPDDNTGLPAVQKTDNGLLLPAVQTDHGLLLPAVRMDGGDTSIHDGTSNTIMFGEVVKPSLPADDEVLVAFEFGDKGADYSGSHILYQDINIPAHTGGVNAVLCDGSVRNAAPSSDGSTGGSMDNQLGYEFIVFM